jgi:3-oxoacyl-[acyl-carrier-protein] synthase-1
MEEAVLRIRMGQSKFCLVGGADSYQDGNTLAWLDGTGRLKSNRNRDGLIPGEAAAALLLESRRQAEARGEKILARIEGLGRGLEKNPRESGRPSGGTGLVQALRAAMGNAENPLEVEWVAGDLNGESYRAREWGLSQVMLLEHFRRLKHIWHPADSLGDVGAASGAVLVSLAARAWDKEYAPAEKCLIFAGSDDGSRGALLLQRP